MTSKKLTKDNVIESLKKVVDPEIGIDIWTLGLIYEINIKRKDGIYVKMTFTSLMCPYGPVLVENVKNELKQIGFNNPEIEVVFSPPWQPSNEVKMILGLT